MARFSSVQSLSHVRLFATPWIAARQASCPSPIPGVYSNSCSSSWWCHPAISFSVVPFFSCPQSLPTPGSFPMSQLIAAAATAKSLQSCPTLRPHRGQPTRLRCPGCSPGRNTSGLPFPSPMHGSEKWKWSPSVMSNSSWPHGLQTTRLLCQWDFPVKSGLPLPSPQLVAWGGQRIGVSTSASVLPMNTQDWPPLGWTGWISLQSKGFSRVFSNTTVQKHQFCAQLSSHSNSHIHAWPLEKP